MKWSEVIMSSPGNCSICLKLYWCWHKKNHPIKLLIAFSWSLFAIISRKFGVRDSDLTLVHMTSIFVLWFCHNYKWIILNPKYFNKPHCITLHHYLYISILVILFFFFFTMCGMPSCCFMFGQKLSNTNFFAVFFLFQLQSIRKLVFFLCSWTPRILK